MELKQRLMKLYEAEIQKIIDIRQDLRSLQTMTDQDLIALVDKAAKCKRIQDKAWKEICGNDIKMRDVEIIVNNSDEIREDFQSIHSMEEKRKEIWEQREADKKELSRLEKKEVKSSSNRRNKALLAGSFLIMLIVSIFYHIIMFKKYQMLVIPSIILLIGLPLAGTLIFGFSLWKDLEEENEKKMAVILRRLEEGEVEEQKIEAILDFYRMKYATVYSEIDEYLWKIYPYVEQILSRLNQREGYKKFRNDFMDVMNQLQFKQPGAYVYVPEIFLEEEAQIHFVQNLDAKMKKMDEYMVETVERP